MATSGLSARTEPFRGVRPLNLSRDTTQVVRLLNLVFGPTIEQEGQRLLDGSLATGAFMARINQMTQTASPGFVWEEDRRIVGNVSLMSSPVSGRYLIANVAVHPDFRRRGIGRVLMERAMEAVVQKRGRAVLLQVRDDNAEAIRLYQSLAFKLVGTMSSWQASAHQLNELNQHSSGLIIRPLARSEWEEAIQLDRTVTPPDLDWPEPLPYDIYKSGFWRWFYNLVNGRQVETWTTVRQGQIAGLAQITSEFGRPHQLRVRVAPEWQTELTRPLLAKLLRRLGYMRYRAVIMDHPAEDETMKPLLHQAGFRLVRTLSTMKIVL